MHLLQQKTNITEHCRNIQFDRQCRTGWLPCRVKLPYRKVWLTLTARVPRSNAANIGCRKTWKQSEFCTLQCTSPAEGQTSCKVWLTSIDRCQCNNEANTRNTLKFAGVPQAGKPISAASWPKLPYCKKMWRCGCLKFFSDCRYMP